MTVESIKKACGLVNNNITSIFRQYLGVGPREYIINQKLKAAAVVLCNSNVNVYLLATGLGYTEEAFSRLFKKTFGCTPTQYRRENVKRKDQEK